MLFLIEILNFFTKSKATVKIVFLYKHAMVNLWIRASGNGFMRQFLGKYIKVAEVD